MRHVQWQQLRATGLRCVCPPPRCRGGEELKDGTLFLPKPPLYWYEVPKTDLAALAAAARGRLRVAVDCFAQAAERMLQDPMTAGAGHGGGGGLFVGIRPLLAGGLVCEETYWYEQQHREPPPPAGNAAGGGRQMAAAATAAMAASKKDEVDAICRAQGELGSALSAEQQLLCLEQEYHQLKEFRLFDQATAVQVHTAAHTALQLRALRCRCRRNSCRTRLLF